MEAFIAWAAFILVLPLLNSEPKTTVILLDNNTTHNAIDVSTQAGKVSIDQPYYATTLSSASKMPAGVEKVDPSTVEEKFGDVLSSLPLKPQSILFYFEPGTAEITQASKEQADEIINIVTAYEPAFIDIIGHSDRAGEAQKNYELALERARVVEAFLAEKKVNLERVNVLSHGENDPIVPTEDGVSEPQNRRVEVFIR